MARTFSLMAALFVVALAAVASEAIVPYAALYESLRPALEVSAHDHLEAHARIVSKRADVPPEAIRLEIRARDGVRVVQVESDGGFSFPLDPALRDENPPVATNQPRGSLTLSVAILLKRPRGARFPYTEIAAGIDQMRRVIATDQTVRQLRVIGVELWFDPAAQARLNIGGRVEQLLMADRAGRIVLDDSPQLRESGVMLVASSLPRQIVPILATGR